MSRKQGESRSRNPGASARLAPSVCLGGIQVIPGAITCSRNCRWMYAELSTGWRLPARSNPRGGCMPLKSRACGGYATLLPRLLAGLQG